MNHATVFTVVEDKVQGVFVSGCVDPYKFGDVLMENYKEFDDVIEMFSFGAIKKLGVTVEKTEFYDFENPEIWSSETISDFVEKYGMKNNFFYDSLYGEWLMMKSSDVKNA